MVITLPMFCVGILVIFVVEGWRGLGEFIKNGKLLPKVIFQIILNEVLKSSKRFWKMISIDVKADVKQQKIYKD